MGDKYYCSKCEHFHYYGVIYEKHKQYKQRSERDNLPTDHFLSLEEESLKILRQNKKALRQLLWLYLKYTRSTRKQLYMKEINKILRSIKHKV